MRIHNALHVAKTSARTAANGGTMEADWNVATPVENDPFLVLLFLLVV